MDWLVKADLLAFPDAFKDTVGTALSFAQFGGKHPAMKPWKGQDVEDPDVTLGSGNVFADFGFADADERMIKARLAFQISEIIRRRRLTQTRAAELLAVNQPKVSALMNAKLEGFSIERLMGFLTSLDRDVEIVIRKKPKSQHTGRILVSAA